MNGCMYLAGLIRNLEELTKDCKDLQLIRINIQTIKEELAEDRTDNYLKARLAKLRLDAEERHESIMAVIGQLKNLDGLYEGLNYFLQKEI